MSNGTVADALRLSQRLLRLFDEVLAKLSANCSFYSVSSRIDGLRGGPYPHRRMAIATRPAQLSGDLLNVG
jgi:hypothetical protein